MRILFSIVLVFSLFVSFNSYAQKSSTGGEKSGFFTSDDWEKHKHEIFFTGGPSFFWGDVGGLDRIGTVKSPIDLDGKSIRFMAGLGYRYRFHARWATTTQLAYSMLSGRDEFTNDIIRNSRNLSFRTHLLELGQRIEFIIYAKEDPTATYTDNRERADLIYVFGGINGFFYNPETKINGKWKSLRPLKTEGQGMPGGAKPYGMFNFGIPVGVGFRIGLQNDWRIGLEISYTKTFTDYLDDVSTEYYDPAALAAHGGQDAVYAANPSKANHSWFQAGQQRGNSKDMDAYVYANITVTKNLTQGKQKAIYSRPKF